MQRDMPKAVPKAMRTDSQRGLPRVALRAVPRVVSKDRLREMSDGKRGSIGSLKRASCRRTSVCRLKKETQTVGNSPIRSQKEHSR